MLVVGADTSTVRGVSRIDRQERHLKILSLMEHSNGPLLIDCYV